MTHGMTKADQIRSYPHMKAREVADLLGLTPKQVHTQRWTDRNPERFKESNKKYRTSPKGRRTRRFNDNANLVLARASGFGGIQGGKWQPADDLHLIKMIKAKKSYSACGRAFGVTRNAVAGRVTRLRAEGRL